MAEEDAKSSGYDEKVNNEPVYIAEMQSSSLNPCMSRQRWDLCHNMIPFYILAAGFVLTALDYRIIIKLQVLMTSHYITLCDSPPSTP